LERRSRPQGWEASNSRPLCLQSIVSPYLGGILPYPSLEPPNLLLLLSKIVKSWCIWASSATIEETCCNSTSI
jgi:hypothetical protein